MPARDPLPPPVASPLAFITPSTAALLRSCALRSVFGHSPPHRRLASRGPFVRLGNIAHDVIEAVGLGALDRLEPAAWDGRIAELWDERADREASDIASSFSDVRLGHPSTWRHVEERFAATLFECRELAAVRTRAGVASPIQPSVPRIHGSPPRNEELSACGQPVTAPALSAFEEELASRDGRLRGRPDHVKSVNGELVIEDYKSGTVFETSVDTCAEPTMRENYRRQLLFYAVLSREAFGRWPARLVLRPIGDSPVTIEVTPAIEREADAEASEALALLDRYNSMAGGDPWDLANPAPDICCTCAFRGPCDPFWHAARTDWPPLDRAALAGTVIGITTLGSGRPLLSLQVTAGTAACADISVRQLSDDQLTTPTRRINRGDHVRLVGLRRGDEITATPSTEVWLGVPVR